MTRFSSSIYYVNTIVECPFKALSRVYFREDEDNLQLHINRSCLSFH